MESYIFSCLGYILVYCIYRPKGQLFMKTRGNKNEFWFKNTFFKVFFFWCAFAEEISWLMIVKAQLSQLITQQVVGVSSQATHPTSFFANGSFQSRDSHFVRVRSFSSAPSFLDPHLVLLPLIFILILILLVLFLVLDLLLFSICFSSSFSSFYSSITSSS